MLNLSYEIIFRRRILKMADNRLLEEETREDVFEEINELYRKTQESRESIVTKTYRTVLTVLVGVTAMLCITVIVLAIGWAHEQGTIVPEIVEVEKEVTVTVPEYIIIDPSEEYDHSLTNDSFELWDTNYGPIWMPAMANVSKNEYINEKFIKDEVTGYLTYEDENLDILQGVDVSIYQGDIEWDKVKEAGFDFVIIRCGFRGYVTASVNADANFRSNIQGALDAGLKVGVYFFSQAIDTEEALEEANFVLDLIDGYDISFPVIYDWEVVIDKDGDPVRTAEIEPEQLTANALVFCERVEMAGYTPMIYCNKKTAIWKYDLSMLEDIDIWLAEYSDAPTYFYDFEMWQYSSKGQVPGIEGNVDLNIAFKDYSKKEK